MSFTPDQEQIELAKAPSGIADLIELYGWRDIARELRALGFRPSTDGLSGDFIAQDDREPSEGFPHGHGPYIAAWLRTDVACPFPDMLRGDHGHPDQPAPAKEDEAPGAPEAD